MNRVALREAAGRAGILPSAYSLDGDVKDQTYVLSLEEGGWSVYFADRGKRVDEERFETEDEACDELLLRLTKDQTTRRY